MTAPIVMFVYARPEHTARTLAALQANDLASESDLIIYSDAARSTKDLARVAAVRQTIRRASGFKTIRIVERTENRGLARNIVEGVSEVCAQFGNVIVLEDDIVTSPSFLSYMNSALTAYENVADVWHISGWTYPLDANGLGDAYFWRVMNCWGWGTWNDRWRHFAKDAAYLLATWSESDIDRFNLGGSHDFWAQVRANSTGTLDTWAVFWYATIFSRGGLCLTPSTPYVDNIGRDGTGENCAESETDYRNPVSHGLASLPTLIVESTVAIERLQEYFQSHARRGLASRLRSAFRRVMTGAR